MANLGSLPVKIRSKNAGPFWLTVDIFCDTQAVFNTIRAALTAPRIASFLRAPEDTLLRFEIESLNVLKFSLHRPHVQGSRMDRDIHGAQLAVRLAEMDINE